MSAESLAQPQAGETTRDNGFVLLPERAGTIRETIAFDNLGQRSTKYNSPGVDPENPYNAFAKPADEQWVGDTHEQEDTPEGPEQGPDVHTEVLEGVVNELDALTAKNKEQEERISELERQLAELLGRKQEQEAEEEPAEEQEQEDEPVEQEEEADEEVEETEKDTDETEETDEPGAETDDVESDETDETGEETGVQSNETDETVDGTSNETESSAELSFGNYAELYAQRKNLASTKEGQAKLEAEGDRVAGAISEHVSGRVANFIENNPEASEDEIRQAAMGFYLEAQNGLEREIIDHIDGNKVDGQEAKGFKGALRRFGAWMDRNGSKIKKGLLIVGGIGLVATGIGAATGALTIGFAIGAGTLIGAAKGASVGALLQRHGSRNSAAREVNFQSPEAQEVMAGLDPGDRETYDAISNWLVTQYDSAADKDHSNNVKKTATAAIIGGALGAVAGSLQVETATSQDVTTTETTPNAAPAPVSHEIAPGELSGQVLDKLMSDNGVNLAQFLQANNITGYGDSFTLPDGSTNIPLIHAVENAFGSSFGTIGQVHSYAGADALSDPGISSIFDSIHTHVDWGSTTASTVTTVAGSEVNVPWTVVAAGSASLVGDGVTKAIADRTVRQQGTTERRQVEQ